MHIRLTLALAFTAGLLSTAAVAQSSEDQQACMNDAFRVCSARIPDRARTTACMVQNKSKLSAACQMVMDKYSPATQTTATAYAAPAPAAPIRTQNVSMKPVKTAATTAARPGKPLNILMR